MNEWPNLQCGEFFGCWMNESTSQEPSQIPSLFGNLFLFLGSSLFQMISLFSSSHRKCLYFVMALIFCLIIVLINIVSRYYLIYFCPQEYVAVRYVYRAHQINICEIKIQV